MPHLLVVSGTSMSAADVPADGSIAVAAGPRPPSAQYISWVALAMMTTSSVASLRAAPTMAVYGLACVFLYLLPGDRVPAADVAGLGGAGLRLGGRRLQLGLARASPSRWASWRCGASSR